MKCSICNGDIKDEYGTQFFRLSVVEMMTGEMAMFPMETEKVTACCPGCVGVHLKNHIQRMEKVMQYDGD